ncbi:MAG TPA: zinc ribbon domain-containing protein [Phycisphaerae bacterium]|nr:zinc ribbon domain-containing protein [Phycisphaerae bacterium]HNU44699.1 zinc ribbon domain-containing protein [Phycisphaerae bacterium]
MAAKQTGYRIEDARGRTVRQLDPVSLLVRHCERPIEVDTLTAIVEELEPGTARLRRWMIVIVPGFILLVVVGVAALYWVEDAGGRADLISTLLNPAISVPGLIAGVFTPWFAARQARAQRIRFAMLKHRRCPHCGYDLRGSYPDPSDAATVCPECGCAWLIDDEALAKGLAAALPFGGQPRSRRSVALVMGLLVGLTLLAVLGTIVFMMR